MEAAMKSRYHTILVSLAILLVCGGGCSTVQQITSWVQGGGPNGDEPDPDADPVAAAALRLRRPASVSEYGTEAETARNGWSNRYQAPVADTIAYGMAMDEVASIWGEPGSIDSAGDPRDGNQRWTYYSGLSSRYGLGTKRVVYFESGHVAGWRASQ
jgi:hypothetical protein